MTRLLMIVSALVLAMPAWSQVTALTGARIHTVGPQGTLEDATVVIDGDRILAVGTEVEIPDDAEIFDASGLIITPGLFSSFGQLGLNEVGLSADPIDSAQRGDQFTAGFDVADAYNPRSTLVAVNRIEGVTRAVIAPTPGYPDETGNSGHILAGLAAVVNLGDTDYLQRSRVAVVVALGETGAAFSAGSRTNAWLTLRNALDEALDYRANRADVESGNRFTYHFSLTDLEALQGVINGNTPLIVAIDRASDIEVLVDFVEEYGINAIILGGAEAWMLADELAIAGIPVIVQPTQNLPANFDRLNARRGAAGILAAAGVKIAISDPDTETHNARNLTQAAGNAVADGLDWDTALRAITLSPAEIFGVAATTGSIEPGKAADLVLWPADPLELTSYPDQVFINGVAIPMVSRQTLLRDRYLQNDSELPPAYRD